MGKKELLKTTKIFFALFSLYVLLIRPSRADELIRPGFYQVQPEDTAFGSLLHLRNQDMISENFPDRIVRGLKGNFGYEGEISTYFRKDGKQIYYWSDEDSRRSGRLSFWRLEDGTLSMRIEGEKRILTLKFIGNRAPTDEELGIRTKYFAHRGFSYFPPYNSEAIYPANSLPALKAAIQTGYGGFEFDVRVSQDGKFIVSHDEKLSVATNCEGKVHEKSLKNLQNCYLIASTLVPELSAIKTPTIVKMVGLSQVLKHFSADSRLEHMVIDIKPDTDNRIADAFRDAIAPFLNRPDYLKKILVLTRSELVIRQMRELNPWSKYFLEGSLGTEPLDNGPDFFPGASDPGAASHDGISLNVGLGMYLPLFVGIYRIAETVDFARKYNYPVIGWTVNLFSELTRVRELVPGLEYLLTDAPLGRIAALQLYSHYSHLLQEPASSSTQSFAPSEKNFLNHKKRESREEKIFSGENVSIQKATRYPIEVHN